MPRRATSQRQRAIDAMRLEARGCRACPIWEKATQTVFGDGAANARFLIVGEQAGDKEDALGLPFVGPAGKLLDQAFEQIGIARDDTYITNVIKHFKFELRGKRRLHKRANAAEVAACSRWLHGELEQVSARHVVCLGALAAHTVIGADFKLQQQRGRWQRLDEQRWVLATVHPSFVLRSRIGGDYEATYAGFIADLKKLRHPPEN
jgi:uracil-DNA glycosylase family protein